MDLANFVQVDTNDPNDLLWINDSNQTATPKGVEDPAPGPEIFDTFKDSQGRFRTQSLFIEYPHPSYPAFFTLKKQDKEKDGKTYISLYRKYMEIADPTEYQVALRLFGSWNHWQALKRSKWFMEHLTDWREELKVKLESERYFEMTEKATKNTPQAIQATKWLADRYGDSKENARKAGRPSAHEKAAYLKKLAEESDDTAGDAARIGIK